MANVTDRIAGRNLIAGRWRDADGDRFESNSPADRGEVVGLFPSSGRATADEAVAAARAAYPAWRRTSRVLRAELFDTLAQLVKRETDNLARLMARECGKVLTECRAEVIEGLHMIQYVFGTGRMPCGDVLASEIAEKDAFVRRKPWGVVAVITPWNFPFAVPLWMLGPSLVEGNTAVFKPSEDTPAIGQRLVELFVEAGFPPGVINLVHGDGNVGEALVRNRDVNVVLFTGSYEVGSHIQQVSATFHDRIVAAEMGSKSAVIVCADARPDLAVNAALISAFKTSGQRCVSAGRAIVHESLVERFSKELAAKAKRLRIGHPLDASNFTGPVINEAAVTKIEQYNRLAREEGGDVLLAGERMSDAERGKGWYLSPTVYRMEARPGVRVVREEVFGPHLAVIPFKTNEEAARIYNDTQYGLSMAVITEDYRAMRFFREECEFGMGYVNLPCIGAEVHLPFGGVKKSGNGHPSAAGLVEAVTHKIAWTVNHGTEIKMAQGLTTAIEGGPA
ncbi:MAG: aldehyde dehydrogenase family protein [Gemmataceae bacterium]